MATSTSLFLHIHFGPMFQAFLIHIKYFFHRCESFLNNFTTTHLKFRHGTNINILKCAENGTAENTRKRGISKYKRYMSPCVSRFRLRSSKNIVCNHYTLIQTLEKQLRYVVKIRASSVLKIYHPDYTVDRERFTQFFRAH